MTEFFNIPGFSSFVFIRGGVLGSLYKAHNDTTNQVVCIEIVDQQIIEDSVDFNNLKKQISTLASLSHKHILRLQDGNVYEGRYYFVYDYTSENSLFNWLEGKQKVSCKNALAIASSIAPALEYAWNNSDLSHNLLSPECIHIDKENKLKVYGLGLEKLLGEGKEKTIINDAYSLGAILYFALTGCNPFDLSDHQPSSFKDPRIYNSKISLSLLQFIRKLMTLDSDYAYQSWVEVCSDLDLLKKGGKISSERIPGNASAVEFNSKSVEAAHQTDDQYIENIKKYRRKEYKSSNMAPVLIFLLMLAAGLFFFNKYATKQSSLSNPKTTRQVPKKKVRTKPVEDKNIVTLHDVLAQKKPAPIKKSPAQKKETVIEEVYERVFDVISSSKPYKDDLLWQAGKLNGLPKNGLSDLVKDEYKVLFSKESSVHARSKDEIPQYIASGQSLNIHTGNLPEEDMILRIALRSSREGKQKYLDVDNRSLRVWFNEELVWSRWIVWNHSIIEMYICSEWVDRFDNTISVSNRGKEVLCLDAVWIQKCKPGPTVFAALKSGNRLSRNNSAFTPFCSLSLPVGYDFSGSSEDLFKKGSIHLQQVIAPASQSDAIRSWKKLNANDGSLVKLHEDLVCLDQTWRSEILKALQRGMLPIVEVRDMYGDESLKYLIPKYGGVVGYWILSGDNERMLDTREYIHSLVRNAKVVFRGGSSMLNDKSLSNSGSSFMLHHQSLSNGGWADCELGCWRLRAWEAGNCRTEPFDHWAYIHTPFTWADVLTQRIHSYTLPESVVQYWMAGGNKAVVAGGEAGGIFFPVDQYSPALSWQSMKHVLQFGDGSHRRSICNVINSDEMTPLASSYWASSVSSSNSVNLIMYFDKSDTGKDIKVTLPVPWLRNTKCVISSVLIDESRRKDPETLPKRVMDVYSSRKSARGDTSAYASLSKSGSVSFTFESSTLNFLQLTPKNSPPAERNLFISDKKTKTINTDKMFVVFDKPLPFAMHYAERRTADGIINTLSAFCSSEEVDASYGSFEEYSFMYPGTGSRKVLVNNVVPWSAKSTLLSLANPDTPNTPSGVRLYFDSMRLSSDDVIGFWIKPINSEPHLTAKKRKLESLVIGNSEKYDKIDLKVDEWSFVATRKYSLDLATQDNKGFIIIRPAPEIAYKQCFEVNGFVSIRKENDSGHAIGKTKCQVKLLSNEGDNVMLIALYGQANKPGSFMMRLPEPISIKSINVVTQSEKNEALGDKVLSYNEDSQIMLLNIGMFPSQIDEDAIDDIKKHFPSNPLISDDSLDSAIIVRCAVGI